MAKPGLTDANNKLLVDKNETEDAGFVLDSGKQTKMQGKIQKMVVKSFGWIDIRKQLVNIYKVESGLLGTNVVVNGLISTPAPNADAKMTAKLSALKFVHNKLKALEATIDGYVDDAVKEITPDLGEGDEITDILPRVVALITPKIQNELRRGGSFYPMLEIVLKDWKHLLPGLMKLSGKSGGMKSGKRKRKH